MEVLESQVFVLTTLKTLNEMERGKIHVHPESWECNGCFLSWCSMLLIASGSSRKNVCSVLFEPVLEWNSVHLSFYPLKG